MLHGEAIMTFNINVNSNATVTLSVRGVQIYNEYLEKYNINEPEAKEGDTVKYPLRMLFNIFGGDPMHPGLSQFGGGNISFNDKDVEREPGKDQFDPLGWWFSEAAALRSRKHDKRALYDKFSELQGLICAVGGYLGYDYAWGDQRDPKKLVKASTMILHGNPKPEPEHGCVFWQKCNGGEVCPSSNQDTCPDAKK